MTHKEQRFCYQYHRLRHGREAAIQAGILPPLAERTAEKLLQRADIWRQIETLDDLRQQRDLKQAIRSGLERLAFGTDNDAVSLLLQSSCDPAQLDLFRVSEIRKTRADTLELKFYDRYEALSLLRILADNTSGEDTLRSLFGSFEHSPDEHFPKEDDHAIFRQTGTGTDLVENIPV